MAGGIYLFIAALFGVATGVIGRSKGSSFALWFLVGAIVPVIGTIAALAYRNDDEEPRRACPACGRTCMLHDALCVGCGTELDWLPEDERLPAIADAPDREPALRDGG